ncbi:MAG TPA: hypothetical protein VN047_05750 [Sphingopyxis sp.]|uniref:hypothetical protein n=1 Tax=Sphingopyxis sp. TaxID=1908224 RepID=UPI002CA98884|nr:hypothetical protein [Sphingopyxis sp.]HWW56375.1 hypothetical protein [Sphingopyxis sp.]
MRIELSNVGGVRVSQHAINRYRERIADLSDEMIIAALSGKAFQVLSLLGHGAVRMACGARAIVQAGTVVTVLPLGQRVLNWHRFSATENF